jgi:hypothetical protein
VSFEGGQVDEGLFFLVLLLDPLEFSQHLLLFAFGDGTHDVALLMDYTALTQRGGKQVGERRQQSLMSIGDQQINLLNSPAARRSWSKTYQPSLLSSALAQKLSTSRLPRRSTPRAVTIMGASVWVPGQTVKWMPSR